VRASLSVAYAVHRAALTSAMLASLFARFAFVLHIIRAHSRGGSLTRALNIVR